MLTRIENQPIASALSEKLFDDETLLTLLQQAQTTQIPVDKLITNYYLFLTANGEIYDDFGEDLSLEKIRAAVSNKCTLVQKCAEASDNELIGIYRNSSAARYTNTAALVKMKSAEPTFNSKQFSVTSCSIFSTERTEATTAKNAAKSPKESSCYLM